MATAKIYFGAPVILSVYWLFMLVRIRGCSTVHDLSAGNPSTRDRMLKVMGRGVD
jgi:hypothetical protein